MATVKKRENRIYPEISSKAYEHPTDRAATAALASIPLLDKVLKKISELGFERSLEQQLLADAVKLSDKQLPKVFSLFTESLTTLDIKAKPDLYIRQFPLINAMTVGSSKPVVIVNSALVSQVEEAELHAVFGHETGHILSEHVHYATVLAILQRLMSSGISTLGKLPIQGLLAILSEWYRCAELSCDRAATLVVDDPLAVCRLLMSTAAGGVKDLNLDAFLTQANEFLESSDLFARHNRWVNELGRSHPYTVRRVGELMRWVQEGDFDRIRSGNYVKKGQEPPPSEQLKAATEHYRQRFSEVLDRIAGGIGRFADQLSDWIKG
ncbi:MAG: M48 family metallopeptidase [Firmicutes bacterium]|nr:M48 family metallopeptidase [Bacillota bacterium]